MMTVIVSLLLVPAFYEIGKVLVPGIPSEYFENDTVPIGFLPKPIKKKHQYGLVRFLKYFSFISPDLWWAYFVEKHLSNLVSAIPFGTRLDAKNVKQLQDEIRENKLESGGFLQSRLDGKGPKQVFLDSVLKPSMPHFRVCSNSKWSGFRKGKGSETRRVFVQRGCDLINGDMLWDTIVAVSNKSGKDDTKYLVVRISRETAEVIEKQIYDSDENGIEQMIKVLSITSSSELLVFVRLSQTGSISIESQLFTALNKVGASTAIADPENQTFAFIGVPYVKIDEESEGITKEIPVLFKEEETMDFRFYLYNYFAEELVNSKAFVELENWGHNPSIIMHTLEPRTDAEDWRWAMRGLYRTPSYWEITKAEYEEFDPNNITSKILVMIAIFFHFGHLFTKVGRFAVRVTAWKYFEFFKACFGVWSDTLVSMYNVHGQVRTQTLAFDNPYSRKLIVDRAKDDRELGDDFIEEVDGQVPASKMEYDRQRDNVKTATTASYQELKRLEYNLQGPGNALAYDTHTILEQDHANALYALIVPRAALLQLIPTIGVFFTVYATETARTPIFVYSDGLLDFLPGFYPQRNAWKETRNKLNNAHEERYNLKMYEANLDCRCVSAEEQELDKATGIMKDIHPRKLNERREVNAEMRAHMKQVLREMPQKAHSYVVAVLGLERFFYDSRLLTFAFNLMIFFIEVLVVLGDRKTHTLLVAISLIITIPASALEALSLIISFGHEVIGITDEELYREFWFLMPIVNCFGAIFSCIISSEEEDGPKHNGKSELEMEMSSFKSNVAVKHNFAKSVKTNNNATTTNNTDTIPGLSADVDLDLENGAIVNPLHHGLTTDFEKIFLDLAYFGKEDDELNDRVWKNISCIEEDEVNQRSKLGDTLILRACQHKCSNLIPLLIRKKADVNAVNADGASCLHFSCDPKHPSARMTRDLLEAGANPNAKLLKSGSTPLHYAAEIDNLELCRLLMKHNVETATKDTKGNTAASYAVKAGHTQLAILLEEAQVQEAQEAQEAQETQETQEAQEVERGAEAQNATSAEIAKSKSESVSIPASISQTASPLHTAHAAHTTKPTQQAAAPATPIKDDKTETAASVSDLARDSWMRDKKELEEKNAYEAKKNRDLEERIARMERAMQNGAL